MDIGDLKSLQVLQNKSAQIVTKSPLRAERLPMYSQLGWLTINQLIFYHSVLAVYKIRSSLESEQLASILTKDSRNFRIIILNLDIRLAQKSFTLKGTENWNDLPLAIRLSPKISKFKKQVKRWVGENVPLFLD